MARVESLTTEAIEEKITENSQCVVGPATPQVPQGQSVLWVDTSAGGYATLNVVIGE
jgi:hypothetical protein